MHSGVLDSFVTASHLVCCPACIVSAHIAASPRSADGVDDLARAFSARPLMV